MTGSLSLGGSFEEKMAAAAELDLKQIKNRAAMGMVKEYDILGNAIYRKPRANAEIDGEDYTKNVVKKKFKNTQEYVERFGLNSPQRTYFIISLASLVLAFGRASKEAPSFLDPIIDISHPLSAVLSVSSVVFSVLSVSIAREKNRNSLMWGIKGIMGGPFVFREIKEIFRIPFSTDADEQQACNLEACEETK